MKIETTKATIEGEKAKKIFTALKQTIEAITEEDSEKETEGKAPESNNDKQPYDKEKLVADLDELCDKIATVVTQFRKIAINNDTQLSYYLSNTFNEKRIEFCKELNAVKSYLNEYYKNEKVDTLK